MEQKGNNQKMNNDLHFSFGSVDGFKKAPQSVSTLSATL